MDSLYVRWYHACKQPYEFQKIIDLIRAGSKIYKCHRDKVPTSKSCGCLEENDDVRNRNFLADLDKVQIKCPHCKYIKHIFKRALDEDDVTMIKNMRILSICDHCKTLKTKSQCKCVAKLNDFLQLQKNAILRQVTRRSSECTESKRTDFFQDLNSERGIKTDSIFSHNLTLKGTRVPIIEGMKYEAYQNEFDKFQQGKTAVLKQEHLVQEEKEVEDKQFQDSQEKDQQDTQEVKIEQHKQEKIREFYEATQKESHSNQSQQSETAVFNKAQSDQKEEEVEVKQSQDRQEKDQQHTKEVKIEQDKQGIIREFYEATQNVSHSNKSQQGETAVLKQTQSDQKEEVEVKQSQDRQEKGQQDTQEVKIEQERQGKIKEFYEANQNESVSDKFQQGETAVLKQVQSDQEEKEVESKQSQNSQEKDQQDIQEAKIVQVKQGKRIKIYEANQNESDSDKSQQGETAVLKQAQSDQKEKEVERKKSQNSQKKGQRDTQEAKIVQVKQGKRIKIYEAKQNESDSDKSQQGETAVLKQAQSDQKEKEVEDKQSQKSQEKDQQDTQEAKIVQVKQGKRIKNYKVNRNESDGDKSQQGKTAVPTQAPLVQKEQKAEGEQSQDGLENYFLIQDSSTKRKTRLKIKNLNNKQSIQDKQNGRKQGKKSVLTDNKEKINERVIEIYTEVSFKDQMVQINLDLPSRNELLENEAKFFLDKKKIQSDINNKEKHINQVDRKLNNIFNAFKFNLDKKTIQSDICHIPQANQSKKTELKVNSLDPVVFIQAKKYLKSMPGLTAKNSVDQDKDDQDKKIMQSRLRKFDSDYSIDQLIKYQLNKANQNQIKANKLAQLFHNKKDGYSTTYFVYKGQGEEPKHYQEKTKRNNVVNDIRLKTIKDKLGDYDEHDFKSYSNMNSVKIFPKFDDLKYKKGKKNKNKKEKALKQNANKQRRHDFSGKNENKHKIAYCDSYFTNENNIRQHDVKNKPHKQSRSFYNTDLCHDISNGLYHQAARNKKKPSDLITNTKYPTAKKEHYTLPKCDRSFGEKTVFQNRHLKPNGIARRKVLNKENLEKNEVCENNSVVVFSFQDGHGAKTKQVTPLLSSEKVNYEPNSIENLNLMMRQESSTKNIMLRKSMNEHSSKYIDCEQQNILKAKNEKALFVKTNNKMGRTTPHNSLNEFKKGVGSLLNKNCVIGDEEVTESDVFTKRLFAITPIPRLPPLPSLSAFKDDNLPKSSDTQFARKFPRINFKTKKTPADYSPEATNFYVESLLQTQINVHNKLAEAKRGFYEELLSLQRERNNILKDISVALHKKALLVPQA